MDQVVCSTLNQALLRKEEPRVLLMDMAMPSRSHEMCTKYTRPQDVSRGLRKARGKNPGGIYLPAVNCYEVVVLSNGDYVIFSHVGTRTT